MCCFHRHFSSVTYLAVHITVINSRSKGDLKRTQQIKFSDENKSFSEQQRTTKGQYETENITRTSKQPVIVRIVTVVFQRKILRVGVKSLVQFLNLK